MNNFGCIDAFIKMSLAILIGFLFGVILALPFMWIWNYIMPYIFGLPTLSWMQSFALMCLIRLVVPTNCNIKK